MFPGKVTGTRLGQEMKLRSAAACLLAIAILFEAIPVYGFETDQYNLSPVPLADIGEEVDEYVAENLKDAVNKINAEINKIDTCLEHENAADGCFGRERSLAKLEYLRSGEAVAKAVYRNLGDGMIPFTKAGSWIEGHRFRGQPARFKTSFFKSIHATAPFNYLTISPTIRMYGEEFGTDKIAHLFQQGYDYYKIYRRASESGLPEEEAVARAVRFGKMTERTYFGTWVSGTYSNADLAANYAGLRFYLGLTREVIVGGRSRPALFRLEEGVWRFNGSAGPSEGVLRPFISRHFNEASNPSKFFSLAGFRALIRRKVKKQSCKQWFERYPGLSRDELEKTTKSLELWYGEDYGFSASKHFITIANTCFDDSEQAGN
jgi:hypothetical protein